MKREIETDELTFEAGFYERLLAGNPDYTDALIALAEVYTRQGRYAEGLDLDRKLTGLLKKDPVVHYNLACSLALTGSNEEALKALRKAIRLGYADWNHLRKDPDFKNLKNDPEFGKLLQDCQLVSSKQGGEE